MNILRRTVIAIGGITVVALIVTLTAPKAVHGIVATLVQVANTSANPVPTVAVDNAALQPFQFSGVNPSGPGFTVLVPSGKRLVIENISVICFETPVNSNLDLRVYTVVGGISADYVSRFEQVGSSIEVIAKQEGRLYADGGTAVTIGTGFGVPPGTSCYASLSGYLVNTP